MALDPVDLLIKDCGLVVAMPGDELTDGWVAVRGQRVVARGPHGSEPEATQVISAGGRLVTPGLVNTHHHLYQNLTRSYAPALRGSLFDWLTTLYPIWARLDAEAVYSSTYVGLAELLLGGCTTSTDHLYVHPEPKLIDAEIEAARELGFRFYPTRGSMTRSSADGGLPPPSVVEDTETILADSERLIATWHDPSPGAMTRVGLAPCSPFSVTPELMRSTAELAAKSGVRLHTHLAEDTAETEYCQQTYGMRPVEYFESVGWATDRSWVAHLIFPSDEEMARLGRAGVGVAHCPSSNMLIGGGTAAVQRLRAMGSPVGIGCDGSGCTDHASLWMETRAAMLLARFLDGPAAMTARDALTIATLGSAQCLGWDDEIGHLHDGALADLVVWEGDATTLAGAHTDPVESWLRCGPMRARTTVVNGEVLVDDGRVLAPDLEQQLSQHRTISHRLQSLPER